MPTRMALNINVVLPNQIPSQIQYRDIVYTYQIKCKLAI